MNSKHELQDFDEALFKHLKQKYSKKNRSAARDDAEKAPKSASKPDTESVDPASAVDKFMNSWKNNIDNEIAVLKNAVSAMEGAIG